VTQIPESIPDSAAPRVPGFGLYTPVRWVTLIVLFLVCLVGLAWVTVRLLPDWVPADQRPLVVGTPLGAIGELMVLLGMLLAGMAVLVGLRRWEAEIGRARAERYRQWSREREEAAREQARARVGLERPDTVEAVLMLDLVQSTELIRERGDEFFRDLLRRIETVYIPVARAHGTRSVDGHGDGFLFCFDRTDQALEAVRAMYARLPAINEAMPPGVAIAFRASLHVGPTVTDPRGNRTGLTVLKAVRLGSVMEMLHGRGAGRNSLIVSEEARAALGPAAQNARFLGQVPLRGFPGTHPAYQLEV
jgi:class 3 adenylate cyclase